MRYFVIILFRKFETLYERLLRNNATECYNCYHQIHMHMLTKLFAQKWNLVRNMSFVNY